MLLSKIRIEKFRGIRAAEIEFVSELALVGQNSSGKSTVLRALNAFFNYDEEAHSFETGRHAFQKTSTSIIDLEFSCVPEDLKLPRISAGAAAFRARLKCRKTPAWQIFTEGQWVQAPSDFHQQISRHIRYVHIPIERTSKALSWSQDSILQAAVLSWVKEYTKNRDHISPKVAEISRIFKDRTFKGLSKHLRSVTHLRGAFEFALDYAKQPDYSILVKDLVLRVIDGETSLDISDCGSGTQSMAAIGLYSYLADVIGGTYILGIEEPEQNLHPQAQRSLLAALRELPLQIIFTTHSTVMIDSLDHEEVALCRRSKSGTRGFEITVKQISREFWNSKKIDREKYVNFYKRRNSEFFYADHVILCESPIDAEVIKHLISDGGINFEKSSISIISLDGVKSLPYAFHLLKELEISFFTIVDKDYFLPYQNDDAISSRDARGFPKYKKSFQRECLIEDILPSENDRSALLRLMHSNHSKAMDLLEKHNIFCFKWSLEVDLVGSTTAQNLLLDEFGIPDSQNRTFNLLVENRKKMKKLESIIPVLKRLSPSNLPNSYKRIRKIIPYHVKVANH